MKPGSAIQCQKSGYTIVKKLAEGGMGVVHLGRSASGHTVVVKEPKITGESNQDLVNVQRLKVETTILKNLNHKHIMRYEDSRDEGNGTYLVVEFIDGETWADSFSGKPLSEDDAEEYIVQVLDAIAYMHDQNVIYRDLKPHNVMLSKHRQNKIIDFGGAKYFYTQIQDPRHQHTQIFTPGWTAPEQVWGGASFQSDMYSVGTSLFFLLTGKSPGLYMDTRGQLKPPSAVNPRVKRLSSVAVKAADPDPNKRYQTASDMINDIRGGLLAVSEPHIICGNHRHVVSGEATIGRGSDCEVPIPDPAKFVSKYHARIFSRGGQFWVEDMGSLNGTFVSQDPSNFQKLAPKSPRELRDNDLIALCYNSSLGPYMTLKFKMSGRS